MESKLPCGKSCPICLKNLSTKHTASPDCCNHDFCVDCLKTWSNINNTCPVDRKVYTRINIKLDGETVNSIKVKNFCDDPTLEFQDLRNVVFGALCSICGENERNLDIICCADCYQNFHLECIGLNEMPETDWYCADCEFISEGDLIEPDEVEMLLEEASDILYPNK